MKAVIYFTEIPEKYVHKNMEHMTGEKLLAAGLYKEFGMKLAFEPRGTWQAVSDVAAEDPLQYQPFREICNVYYYRPGGRN